MPADHIAVIRTGPAARILVGGVEIPPEAILRDSVTVPVDPDEVPSVHLTLVAARVDVHNTLERSPDGPAER
ncbi:hypothetical protein [uncultured Streptomyces sp.]|uniref:hypothetical protein n=1 Tax=uncultured Streptomyces sp. TaxID=174707 RepID=UPI00260C91E3|nr:hypothetical protein [uncultured Streptomyces sp.]